MRLLFFDIEMNPGGRLPAGVHYGRSSLKIKLNQAPSAR